MLITLIDYIGGDRCEQVECVLNSLGSYCVSTMGRTHGALFTSRNSDGSPAWGIGEIKFIRKLPPLFGCFIYNYLSPFFLLDNFMSVLWIVYKISIFKIQGPKTMTCRVLSVQLVLLGP